MTIIYFMLVALAVLGALYWVSKGSKKAITPDPVPAPANPPREGPDVVPEN